MHKMTARLHKVVPVVIFQANRTFIDIFFERKNPKARQEAREEHFFFDLYV
jgi:hypothetical protein